MAYNKFNYFTMWPIEYHTEEAMTICSTEYQLAEHALPDTFISVKIFIFHAIVDFILLDFFVIFII